MISYKQIRPFVPFVPPLYLVLLAWLTFKLGPNALVFFFLIPVLLAAFTVFGFALKEILDEHFN